MNEPGGKVTIFIADFYNGSVRAVGPDGIIRDLTDEGREAFGAPTRVAFDRAAAGLLYVADSSQDRVVPLIIPRIAPNLVPPRPVHAAAEGGRMTEPVKDPPSVSATDGLLGWMLEYMRPYRTKVALLAVLLVSEIGLGALAPWPLAMVIDYVLGGKPFPGLGAAVDSAPPRCNHRFALLVFIVVAGVVLQVVNQLVSAYGTQVQVDTGQRMVYDLRGKLFAHLTSLGLQPPHHHQHGRRRLPRRRRRLRDREPGDERAVPARDVDRSR